MLFRGAVAALGRLMLGFEVWGAENVPRSGPLIVAANHHRFFDPVFVCMAIPRRLQWMAKKELFTFGLRRLVRALGTFPVDRAGGGRAALRAALSFLADGWAVAIFPEGTRGEGGTPRQARSGVVMLATRSGAPVLPVFVDRIPTPAARLRGERFRAYIGEPVTLEKGLRGQEAYRKAAERIMQVIYELPERPGGGSEP